MVVKDINFNELNAMGLAVYVDGELKYNGFIGDVLREIPHLADIEIKDTNYYFDEFVIRL